MPIPDDTLRAAMADAAEGKGVVVLTPSATETDVIVARARQLTIDGLMKFAKATQTVAEGFFATSSIPWQLRLRSQGWVFFIPVTDLKPHEDVGAPSYIFVPKANGMYERLSYTRWRAENMPAREVPPLIDGVEIPKTAWAHLMEDDE